MLKTLILSIVLTSLLSCCSKDKGIIEERLAMNKEVLNVPTTYDLTKIYALSDQEMVVLAQNDDDSLKLYYTANGGQSWSPINAPVPTSNNVLGFAFIDSQFGAIVVDRNLYLTQNAGVNWTMIMYSSFPLETCGIGLTDNNGYVVIENRGQLVEDVLYVNKIGGNPSLITTYDTNYEEYDFVIPTSDSKVFFVNHNANYSGVIKGFDLANNSDFTMPFYNFSQNEKMNDLVYGDSTYIHVHNEGKILSINGRHRFNPHDRPYRGIDFNTSYFIAVSQWSISTNYNGEWEEVVYPNGVGLSEDFYDVSMLDENYFYVCGANGIFYKCTFQ